MNVRRILRAFLTNQIKRWILKKENNTQEPPRDRTRAYNALFQSYISNYFCFQTTLKMYRHLSIDILNTAHQSFIDE